MSFCRVGSGLSDEELEVVLTKLKPHFRKYDYPKKAPPSFYQVTNNSKERPDVWIDSPEKSIILSITSDIRTIRSEVFAAPYSLRFPRIDRVRYEKPWHECLDVQSFVELVHSSNGTTQRVADFGSLLDNKPKRMTSSRKGVKKQVSVPSQFVHTEFSDVKGETSIFSAMVFYFVNAFPSHSLDSLHKMVVENGGGFSMNLNNSVTHCIAAESKGIKYQAAKLQRDIIHYSWVLDCCSQKKLLHLQPKYFLFLSDTSKKKLQEELDEFSDSYYLDIDIADIKQLLSNLDQSENLRVVDYYKKKYCPKRKWSSFQDCCIYFYSSTLSLNVDWDMFLELATRRMMLEVSMGGGKVSDNLLHATHLVVISVPGFDVDFGTLLRSFSAAEQHLLHYRRLHVVRSHWLEDSFDKECKLQEEPYSLRPKGLEREDDLAFQAPRLGGKEGMSSSPIEDAETGSNKAASEDLRILASPRSSGKRKRGGPTGRSVKQGRVTVSQARRARARHGNKAAKIYENESDEGPSDEDAEMNRPSKRDRHEIAGTEIRKIDSETEHDIVMEDIGSEIKLRDQNSGLGIESPEKGKTMADPVQAMLLDMIPSLGRSEPEATKDTSELEKRDSDPIAGPVKKKKVSYKDIAGELLKDW